MPDPITITQDATPPVAEEVVANLEAEAAELQKEGSLPKEEQLIGGEFQSQEDLLAAYNELKAQSEQSTPEPVGTAQEI